LMGAGFTQNKLIPLIYGVPIAKEFTMSGSCLIDSELITSALQIPS